MKNEHILAHVDHTNLSVTATWEDIKKTIDEGIKYGVASCCIPPSFVKKAAEYAAGRVRICTVIGFPNGYNTTEVKYFETANAIADGAKEIDMVINIGWLKEKRFDDILNEIKQVKKVCGMKPGIVLKVIIETCLLTDKEKVKMCKLVTMAGADFIKTSTGFSTGGATVEDVELFAKNVGENVKIKAAGGISSFADAKKMLNAGATRLGTSRLIKIMEADNKPAEPEKKQHETVNVDPVANRKQVYGEHASKKRSKSANKSNNANKNSNNTNKKEKGKK